VIAVDQARRSDPPNALLAPIEAWFSQQGWAPLPFQRQAWHSYLAGDSGLIQVPTGSGKTYAAVMGPIAEMLAVQQGADTTQRLAGAADFERHPQLGGGADHLLARSHGLLRISINAR